MKSKSFNEILNTLEIIDENAQGQLSGGFALFTTSDSKAIIKGLNIICPGTNDTPGCKANTNCSGGNCVVGCGGDPT